MSTPVPLTVVILARNEAERIEACLRSVAWAGEALVVDDESTDGTAARAEALGARVVHRKMDIEGRHRNWASQQARYDWILSIDADERVTPELAAEIAGLFAAGPPMLAHYAIPRRNYIGPRWVRYGGWYPSPQVKLFDRRAFRWEEAAVHPRAFCDGPCGQLHQDLLHYSYRDIGDFVTKLNRQTTLEAEKWLATGRRMPFGKALWRAADRFFRAYVMKRGYRDGVLGFAVAWLGATYQLLSYEKYRERRETRAAAGPPTVAAATAPTPGSGPAAVKS